MGWIFRKSLNFGPFRINLSKGGVGGSFGVGPFRIGRRAKGGTYHTANIPGTGISYRSSRGGSGGGGNGCGCAIALLIVLGITVAAVALWVYVQ